MLDVGGIDLAWQGVTTKIDNDIDFVAEALTGGLWSAEIAIASGEMIGVVGSFQGAALE